MSARACAAGAGAAMLAVALSGIAPAQRTYAAEQLPNCLHALVTATSETILCTHPTALTEAERADLARLTQGLLQNARCEITISIARRAVEEAIVADDLVFESPPHPARCDLETKNGPMAITGTFAPRVVFKGGEAVEATPGLGNVTGVNFLVAWPVVHYVNHAPRIRGAMLTITNAVRSRLREMRQETLR